MNSKSLFDYEDEVLERSHVKNLSAVEQDLKKEIQLKWMRDIQEELKKKIWADESERQRKDEDARLSEEHAEV